MGAETELNADDVRWLSPLPLWTGILAGPVAWALDLGVSYALVKWSCSSERGLALHLITLLALALVAAGAGVSWFALQGVTDIEPTDGGEPRQRAKFMAILGLGSSALFALTMIAGAIPRWVLDACQ